MKSSIVFYALIVLLAIPCIILANSAPLVSNVTASQRTDGSGIVDIYYTLSDLDNDLCTVTIAISNNGGASWVVTAKSLSGDIGENTSPGDNYIIWDCKNDMPGETGVNYQAKVTADDGIIDGPTGMVWIQILSDPGITGHEGFAGFMSKYEITNSQYCEFLNDAIASGDIIVSPDNNAYGAIGANSGEDFEDELYLKTHETAPESQINYSDGTFSTGSRDFKTMGPHPVVMVTWYGAKAFCNYYGYQLPTEWQWQAVADYNGTYIYGCGTSISSSKANYQLGNPQNLSSYPYTSQVGYYQPCGYGLCDMAGNVGEYTQSYYDTSSTTFTIRGGCWHYYDGYCKVDRRNGTYPYATYNNTGFRPCR